jgi:hypothetical protein
VIRLPEDVKPEPKPVAPVMPEEPVLITKEEPVLITKEEPVIAAVPAEPVAQSQPEPAAQKNVFVLEVEDEEGIAPAPVAQPVVAHEDNMVSGIHMMDSTADDVAVLDSFAPVAQPAATVAAQPTTDEMAERLAAQPFEPKNDIRLTSDRASRIARIHQLLRNDPNGAEKVQSMSTQEISTDELYAGAHSSTRESSSYTMRPDGTMAKNAYFGDQPD